MESHLRSITKALSWRVAGTLTTAIIVWVLTGSLKLGSIAGLADFLVKIVLYYLHERIWHKISWGISRSTVNKGGNV